MTNQVRCPHCGKDQLPTIRVQTIECPANQATGKEDPRKTLRVLLVLLLSLTIIGLPIAYWLCRRFEKEYPLPVDPVLKYSYQCSLCGYAWTKRTDERTDEQLTKSSLGNSGQRDDNARALLTTPENSVAHPSFLRKLVAWWLGV